VQVFIRGVNNELIRELVAHSLARGGKRLRPQVLLLCCELNGGSIEKAAGAALSVELVHTASLVQDDIIDDATIRRGGQPAAKAFGNLQAVMVSDYLISRAVEAIAPYGPRVVGWLGELGCALVEGELMDYDSGKTRIDEAGYWRLVSLKTARLFEISALMGVEIADPGSTGVQRCAMFGREFGMAYQLSDDLGEFKGSQKGKQSTYRARTLPRILSERLTRDEAVKECEREIGQHLNAALGALDGFPACRAGERLAELAKISCGV